MPAICMNVGPMLNGYSQGELAGSGTIVWKGRELRLKGAIDEHEMIDYISQG